eukprot:gnl/MRDRNA2_/MRDRNA2_91694_c0_seq1.p1 gnl/MRDRNA2_/MRDRNA2_91694_c0~~gnl/MRDRNA2_/MRDRNA2_91694_c0_seq1.p1  ORF type:complete len:243 (-),score=74.01 gnl/MRDRNA2_/MRDRNA2_91694_c0_seq1:12-740(-)
MGTHLLSPKEKHLLLARCAEEAQRYDEMAHHMCQAAEQGDLSYDERKLLGSAYQQAVASRRQAWQRIAASEKAEEVAENEQMKLLTEELRLKVEKELQDLCDELLDLLKKLMPKQPQGESGAFFLKLQGDFFRYIAEFATGADKRRALDNAKEAYLKGTDVSRDFLLVTHPTRLGLSLNFAIFTAVVLEDKEGAAGIAADAYDAAVSELDNISEEAYAACTLTLRLLKDHIEEWSDTSSEQT